ncbi:MAG: (d)CMP kinase [Opitutales bacterium]|nr:(d)CMP kinase [Opitutales bacterium]
MTPYMSEGFQIVAIDGGAASGKSSTARGVAGAAHFLHVDTGSHYRAVTLRALAEGLEPREGPALDRFLAGLRFESEVRGRCACIRLNDEVPARADIRSDAVNAAVSAFAALPAVREAVRAYQRDQAGVARQHGFKGLVMDGRDIGTVIFPDADLKVYLEADASTRAARRKEEGQTDTIDDRDRIDSTRATAPLAAAPDAVRIDNSNIPLEGVVDEVLRLLRERSAGARAEESPTQ